MSMPLFSRIPIAELRRSHAGDPTPELAAELDESSFVNRASPDDLGNTFVEPEEVRAGLMMIETLSPERQDALRHLAKLLGIDTPSTAPVQGPDGPKLEWAERTEPPRGAKYGQPAVGAGRIYTNIRDELLRYDPKSDRWSPITLPDWPKGARLTRLGDKLAVVRHTPGGTMRLANHSMIYDPATRRTRILEMPNRIRDPAAAAIGDKLYLIGGIEQQSNKREDTVMVYDESADSWTQLDPLPVPRKNATAIAFGDKIFVIGGDVENRALTDRIDVFDTATGTWQDPPLQMARGLRDHTVWIQDGRIHISGGRDHSGTSGTERTNNIVDSLDPDTGEIREETPLPVEQWANAMVANVGDTLHVFGATEVKGLKSDRAHLALVPAAPATPPHPSTVTTNNNTTVIQVHETKVVTNVDIGLRQINIAHPDFAYPFSVPLLEMFTAQTLGAAGYYGEGMTLRLTEGRHDLVVAAPTANGGVTLQGRVGRKSGPLDSKQRRDLYLFHEPSNTVVPVFPKRDGSFDVELPPQVHGPVCLFRYTEADGPSPGAMIDIP